MIAFAFTAGSGLRLSVPQQHSLGCARSGKHENFRKRRVSVRQMCIGSPDGDKPATGQAAKAREFAKLYGGSYLGTSMSMAVVSYAIWYLLVKAGVDVVGLVQALGDWLATTPVGRPAILSRVNETVGTATLAYIAHKASSPLRFPLTLAATPFVARAFSNKNSEATDTGGDE